MQDQHINYPEVLDSDSEGLINNSSVAKLPSRDRMSVNGWAMMPKTFSELQDFCNILAKSSFVPKAFQGKPGDIVVVIQMGASLGLNPFQALQGIACVNGNPKVWGKTLRALVFRTPGFESIEERLITDGPEDQQGAICTMTHKTRGSLTVKFTMADARKAGLLGNPTWTKYPLVMCGHRAFSRCADGLIPDATMGFGMAENSEADEVDMIEVGTEVTPNRSFPAKDGVDRILDMLPYNSYDTNITLTEQEI